MRTELESRNFCLWHLGIWFLLLFHTSQPCLTQQQAFTSVGQHVANRHSAEGSPDHMAKDVTWFQKWNEKQLNCLKLFLFSPFHINGTFSESTEMKAGQNRGYDFCAFRGMLSLLCSAPLVPLWAFTGQDVVALMSLECGKGMGQGQEHASA